MKTYDVLISAVLLVGSVYLHAGEPPELEEWFYIDGNESWMLGGIGKAFSYLPDFDLGRGGTNATLVTVHSSLPTWYNRYHGDTVNQFSWPVLSGGGMRKVDLNGDGIEEYIAKNGKVHRGLGNGIPPESDYIDYFNVISSVVAWDFYDIDNDGYIDGIANSSYSSPTRLMKILWGGSDLTQLKVSEIFRRREDKRSETLVGLLPQQNTSGKVRIITRSYEESGFQQAKWISYVLREMTAIHEADSVRFEFTTLDSISDAGLRPTAEFNLFDGLIFQSRYDQPVLFLTAVLGKQTVQVYCLDEGRFRLTQEFFPPRLFAYDMRGSINGDDYRDLKLTAGSERYYYAGGRGETIDTVSFAHSSRRCDVGEAFNDDCIGDVTGDGIGDIGESYNNDVGCFRILKGLANRPVDVIDPTPGSVVYRPFDMQQNYPNPVGTERRTTLRFSSEKPQHLVFTLSTLDGRFIAELFAGYVPQGIHELPIDLASYRLSSGMYLLRLSNGEGVRERGILIQ